jgi:2-aminobenzoate-CoA ligase
VALCDIRLLEELDLARKDRPVLATVVPFNALNEPGSLAVRSAQKEGGVAACPTSADDIAMMAFTSGTTGKPKAAVHTHRDILAACEAWPRHVLRATPDDIVVGSPPLAFTFGLGGLLVFPMWAGCSVYFPEAPYTPESMVRTINEIGATICYTAPTFYRAMAPFAKELGVGKLRISVSAGEGLPDATRQLWKQASGIEITDGIGATEMFHIFISSAPGDVKRGAIGKVVPGYEAKVVDDDGNEVPRGTIGKLAVIGATGCKYLDDPRQTNYVKAGWNYPGDAFMQDEDGYFIYQARADDMIISAGYNIGGPEVEPAFTSDRSAATRLRSRSFSASSVIAVSARSSGRPDVTRPASWRVQIARLVALKTVRAKSWEPKAAFASCAAPATGCTCKGTSCCARSRPRTDLAVSASITPRRVSPWASRASNE